MKRLALLVQLCVAATSIAAVGCYSHPFEVCNGIDDDDDPKTVDGLEDPLLGQDCDGPDADLCGEGSLVCIDGTLQCNDNTSDNVEECNGMDDDCNDATDEIFDLQTDPTNCGACNKTCTNANGGVACTAGMCDPACANGAVDCNSNPDDGCEVFRDRNPSCEEISGTDAVAGDSGGTAMFEGTDEGVYVVTLQELSTTSTAVRGTIRLDVPQGLDFDLFVYCDMCGGAIMGSSRNGPGMAEVVEFAAPDISNVNDDHTVYIEVRFVSETTCGAKWMLTVEGGAGSTPTTCR